MNEWFKNISTARDAGFFIQKYKIQIILMLLRLLISDSTFCVHNIQIHHMTLTSESKQWNLED